MSSVPVSRGVALRLAPTRASEGRLLRAVARACAVGALTLGLWQTFAVENGALGTFAGLGLIGLAVPLARGRARAHRWACLLLLVLAGTAVWRSGSGPNLALALGALVLLLGSVRAFPVIGDPATRRAVLLAIAVAAVAGGADLAHARGMLGHPLALTAICVTSVLVFRSLRPWRLGSAAEHERERAAELVQRHGADTLAPFALRSDKCYFFDPGNEAVLAYRVVAGVAVVSGDPIGPDHLVAGLIARFAGHARRRGWVVAGVGVGTERLRDWRALGLHAHYTGDEAVVDPSAFSLDGRAIRKVRQSVTRLVRMGYRVELLRSSQIDGPLAAALAAIAEGWREGRVETGFSMAFESAAVHGTRDDLYAVARDADGRARGFLHLALVPAGRALSLSSMRRDRSTPNGLNEFLICEVLAWAREHGVERVSLNFAAFAKMLEAPAAVDRVTSIERWLLRRLSGTFQLERLLAFNRKFATSWTPRYAVYPSLAALPRVAFAVMLAEAYVVLPGCRRRA